MSSAEPPTDPSGAPPQSRQQQNPPQQNPPQYQQQQYPPQYQQQQYPPQQYPGQQSARQYPPQQYPPQQYPPQQYPGQYSGQQYPPQQYPPPPYPAATSGQNWPAPGQPPYPSHPPAMPYIGSPEPSRAQPDAAKYPAIPIDVSDPSQTSRRAVIVGAGIAVVAGAAGFAWYTVVAPKPTAGASTENGAAGSSGGAPTELATVAAIPQNGGVVLQDKKVVLTRETGDKVHCFSAICTHQGCLVAQVSAGQISCPCHGSTFDANTGAVINGPAASPLAAVPVTVVNGTVYTG